MNINHIPTAPGAMTPAQIYRRAAQRAAEAAAGLALCIITAAVMLYLIII